MITRAMRQAMKRSEGQAMVLACLTILIVTIAVLTTVNLGHNIAERQRLQNTSDAAAYSMAALEARAFNFYAFVNRTHVSHYVTAMVWQSILSFTYFTEAFVVDVYGMAKTLFPCADAGFPMENLCDVFFSSLGPMVRMVYNFVKQYLDMYRQLVKGYIEYLKAQDPDDHIGREVIPLYFAMNAMLTGAAEATLQATLQQVKSTSSDVVMANDRNVGPTGARMLSGALSSCILSRTHMREAWHTEGSQLPWGINHFLHLNPLARSDTSKISRAKRAMGSVSNATRFGLDAKNNGNGGVAGPGWVTSRKINDIIEFPSDWKDLHDAIEKMQEWKWGQTKMLSSSGNHRNGRNWPNDNNLAFGGNRIRDWADPPNAPDGMLAQGDDLGSDDVYNINVGPDEFHILGFDIKNPFACKPNENPDECWGDPRLGLHDSGHLPYRFMMKTSIWALSSGRPSIHYRLVSMHRPGRPHPIEAGPANLPTPYNPIDNPDQDIGINRIQVAHFLGLRFYKYIGNVRGVEDGNHPWQGIAPFPHLEPGDYGAQCGWGQNATGVASLSRAAPRTREFNQPSSFVALQKSPTELQNAGDPTQGNNKPALLNAKGELAFGFTSSGAKLALDNARDNFLGAKGLYVISRGQTYYHRPGNWHEHPNFFNPYWRPRLASVLQGEYANPMVNMYLSRLPAPLSSTPQKVLTH